MCRGRVLLKVWQCRGKSKKTTTQPRANPSVIVLHPAREGRGKGLSTVARLADILEHDRLGHLIDSAHGGQSRISLSRGS